MKVDNMVRLVLAAAGILLCALIIFMDMHQLRGYLLILAGMICLDQGVSAFRQKRLKLLGSIEVILAICLVWLAIDSFI